MMGYAESLDYLTKEYYEMLAASRVIGFPHAALKPNNLLFGVKVNWGAGPNSYVLAPAEPGKRVSICFSPRDLKSDPELLLIRTHDRGITEIGACSGSHHLGGTYYIHESLDTVAGMIHPGLLHTVSADEFEQISFQFNENINLWMCQKMPSRAERIRIVTQ